MYSLSPVIVRTAIAGNWVPVQSDVEPHHQHCTYALRNMTET